MGIKFNPNSELAQLFPMNAEGIVATCTDIIDKLKSSTEKIDVKSDEPVVHESLAPSFGDLAKAGEAVKELDAKMKLMIAISMQKLLEYKKNGGLSWKNVQGCFNTNPSLVPMEESQELTKQFVSETSSNFKFNGDPDPVLVQKVLNWWASEACPDVDIRNDSKLDIGSLAKIVAWSGATVTNFVDFWTKHERHERRMLEIGVMRYPTIANPYFKIYRIQLYAWSDCTRTVWAQEDKNGIQSIITWQRFRPNDEVLSKVKEETTKKAVSEIDDMFA
ncbi:hypothetical protein K438DRAFT_2101479 [Mycena galopus ATCC 62051]|nr:hypothetical protein K438DRAFT_2101479 [Mycena galopus ATCC 62051]